jgi:CheY-like chemotaxis protein
MNSFARHFNPNHTPKPMNQNCIILCVDDDEDDREVVCSILQEINPAIKVVHAGNGVAALELLEQAKIKEELPSLIILDMNMPKMNGRDTLVEIQKDDVLRQISTVFLTTHASAEDKDFYATLGVEMLTKPTTFKDLEKELSRLVKVVEKAGNCN